MLAVTDIKKMQQMDSRKKSVDMGGKGKSRRGKFSTYTVFLFSLLLAILSFKNR